MVSKKPQYKYYLLSIALLLVLGSAYSQVEEPYIEYYDTSEYIPSFYKGALDYNLMIAASNGYGREIERLVKEGADVNAETNEGVTPLVFAVAANRQEVVKLLIKAGADVNKITSKYETPLLIAVKYQYAEIAEALIRAGAEIDFSDRHDATALHYAALYGYFQLADMLIYYGASIDNKSIEGKTPLLTSIWAGFDDISDLLIQNGANLEARDNEGYTPFLMAAMNGDTLIMELLRKKGVDIYATNLANHNALSLTIIADKTDATKYLLKIGNKWTAPDNHALSPYTVASKYQRKDILKILNDNKIPGNIKYEIDQVDIMLSTRFFIHDIYTGISLAFREPYIGGGIIVGCDTKLWYTRVLQKQSEHTYYQYMSKGSVIYAGLFKDFALTDYAYKGNFAFSASLSAGYTFGNELKGTYYTPQDKFKVIPAISFKWVKKDLSFSLGADYMKSEFYHVGPVWIRFGASYNLFFDNVRTKGKYLKWY